MITCNLEPPLLNRPLYVSGYIRNHKISHMLLDDESVVNMMLIKTMKKIRIPTDELSKSKLLIQSFNQKGQKVIGMICVQLEICEMVSSSIFHAIDAKTSYELLVERAWLYENGVVA
ncbi:hypothetical protein CFOL_v3_29411 [Cephalotus follicularis]|uniref:Uncharacterized protein n=1 Tax=Cephalotus follicularis TaxID=3775 RepID=A0A1Q3D0H0_CEPFO|nr:hypothetical protein CFOL_v3_29411 [Cephalotus follicularis]